MQGLREEWQQIVLATYDFISTKAEHDALESWQKLVVLSLLPLEGEPELADADIIFTDFAWLPAEGASL